MSDNSELLLISRPKQPYDQAAKKRYYLRHREERIKYQIEYNKQHKEEIKQYILDNYDRIRAHKEKWDSIHRPSKGVH